MAPEQDRPEVRVGWLPVAALLSNTAYLELDCLERGALLQLLVLQWRAGGAGLPPADTALARILGLSLPKWRKIRSRVLPFFEPDESGRLHHRPTADLLEKAQRAKQAAVERARLGGLAKAASSSASSKLQAGPKKCSKSASSSSSSSERSYKISREESESAPPPPGPAGPTLTRAKSETFPRIKSDSVREWWNGLVGRLGLPAVRVVTAARLRQVRARVREHGGGFDAWRADIEKAAEAAEWARNSGRLTLDFAIGAKTGTKLLEGAYAKAFETMRAPVNGTGRVSTLNDPRKWEGIG